FRLESLQDPPERGLALRVACSCKRAHAVLRRRCPHASSDTLDLTPRTSVTATRKHRSVMGASSIILDILSGDRTRSAREARCRPRGRRLNRALVSQFWSPAVHPKSRRSRDCTGSSRVPFCTVLAPLYCDSSRENATVCYDLPKRHLRRKLRSAKDLFAFR